MKHYYGDLTKHSLISIYFFLHNLDARYKREENLESDSWEEGLHTLEVCAMIALKNHKISEVVLTCLDAMINEIRKGEISQIVRVIR